MASIIPIGDTLAFVGTSHVGASSRPGAIHMARNRCPNARLTLRDRCSPRMVRL